jgi:hypothetical protein
MRFTILIALIAGLTVTETSFAFLLDQREATAKVSARVYQFSCSFGSTSRVKMVALKDSAAGPAGLRIKSPISDELCAALMNAVLKTSPTQRVADVDLTMNLIYTFDSKFGGQTYSTGVTAFENVVPGPTK